VTGDKSRSGRYIGRMIMQVKFVGIPVKDQERALAFYREKLGFKVATDQPMGEGKRWIELRIGGAETRVVLFTPPGQEDRVGTFFNGSLEADNVQKTFEELKAKGVEFVQEPKTEPWGTSAIFKDSEGNQFVLSSK
jgi:predicted enzyme related to lactoylglutathione lyase